MGGKDLKQLQNLSASEKGKIGLIINNLMVSAKISKVSYMKLLE